MKPASFDYFAPTTLDETLELLHEDGDEAKILAGGQSLMPLMNLRLARPQIIVDINRIGGLDGIASTGEGGLTIGALGMKIVQIFIEQRSSLAPECVLSRWGDTALRHLDPDC